MQASRRWPCTQGTLLAHSVGFADVRWWQGSEDGVWSKDPDRYVIRVRYAYAVDGVAYESERLTAWGSSEVGHSRELEDWIRSLPTRQYVDVFYDPRQPGRSALLPGIGRLPAW